MERPILFSAEMVRAILDGRKTQTRRVIKPQPNIFTWHGIECAKWKKEVDCTLDSFPLVMELLSPYGAIGDPLYVRETWGLPSLEMQSMNPSLGIVYKADVAGSTPFPVVDRWRPSIHMPKQFARIWLEVKAVRVERLQDITEEDARDEGAVFDGEPCDHPRHACKEIGCAGTGYRLGFANLWHKTYIKRGYGWDTNPWVWVIEFERIER